MHKINLEHVFQVVILTTLLVLTVFLLLGGAIPETNGPMLDKLLTVFITILNPAALAAAAYGRRRQAEPGTIESAPQGEAGFCRLGILPVLLLWGLLFAGCASVTQNISCGEVAKDVRQSTSDATKLDGNQGTVSPNLSLMPK